jgi:hypothetical protein
MCTVRRGLDVMVTLGSLCAVTACAVQQPRGPTVMALPKEGTSLAVFQQQDQQCRNYAAATISHVQPGQAGTHSAIGNSATVLGAPADSETGAAAGNADVGTGAGAGTALGANDAVANDHDPQTRYNIAYTQCMYSLGNTVQIPPPAGYGYYD